MVAGGPAGGWLLIRFDFPGALFTARKNAEVRSSFSVSHACKPTGAPENYSEPAVLASDSRWETG